VSARSYRSRPRQVIVYVLLVIFALLYLAPFALQIANSFKTNPDATANGLSLVPHPPDLSAWKEVFGIGTTGVTDIPRWFFNSAFVAIVLTISRVFLDSLAGYALARLHFRGRKFVLALVIATLAVPGVVLLIPRFLVVKQLGLFNTYEGMILPIAVDAAGIFLMRQFFIQVPVSLEESARLDGAGIFRTFWSVVLPVVRSGVIVLTIISFQGAWNEFAWYETATDSSSYWTLTTGLANLTNGGLSAGTQYPLKLAAALVTTIPIAILFFVFQRQLVRGRLEGAVKQ
jgi:multiple sugar transport system permease protein